MRRGKAEVGKRYTQTLLENHVLRAFRMLKLNNFTNLRATVLISASFYS